MRPLDWRLLPALDLIGGIRQTAHPARFPVTSQDATRTLLVADPSVLRGPRVLAVWAGGSASCSLPTEVGRELVVGRAVECDLRVNAESVSRRHASFRLVQDRVLVRDLGSSNGTRIDGRRLQAGEESLVLPGQTVAVGSAVLVIHSGIEIEIGAGSDGADPVRIVSQSSPMTQVLFLVDQVAQGDIPVVLIGETGVGKEVTAARIHQRSRRATKPYVRLNCAALGESMLESEIFGHERGAFTGAVAAKPGLFEAADGGTVLLDEVTELTLPVQAKLLRVLESCEVTRLGSVKPRSIDVRFVAATNADLTALVRQGRFRSDLYFRLCGINIRIPPLRERTGEIAGLAEQFLHETSRKLGRRVPVLTESALAWLQSYAWPGNIRELRNLMGRAALLVANGRVDRPDLDGVAAGLGTLQAMEAPPFPSLGSPATASDPPAVAAALGLSNELADIERQRIVEAMEACAGNQTAAAKRLGISRKVLLGRLNLYQLPRPRKQM